MASSVTENIPSLDLHNFVKGSADERAAFVNDLGEAFTKYGFVAIKNHGLSNELVSQLYTTIKTFFDQPDSVKQKYEIPGLAGQRGYTGRGKEHAKGRSVGDMKEFFQIGQPNVNPDDEVLKNYPENVWPTQEVPEMEQVCTQAYKTLEAAGLEMLRAIAIYLELPQDYFDDKAGKGNSIIRTLHYYPIANPDDVPDGAVRAAEHGDINLITLLMGASAGGLEIKRLDGTWIPVTALPDQVVVNVGDMLERLTNNKLRSTLHRVVNPPREELGKSRYSIPFFMHPRSEMKLDCLPQCVTESRPKQHEDITAGEFLDQRLREIGLKK